MLYCPNPDCPHLRCTGSPAEFREGIQRCSDCHTGLTQEPPQLPREESEHILDAATFGMSVNWTLLTQVNNAYEANLIQALLESENVLVSLGDEHMNRLVPAYSPMLGWIKIFVPSEDLPRAQAILAENHSPHVEQLSEAELTQAALASASPEDSQQLPNTFATVGQEAKPLQYEGLPLFVWVILILALLFAMWQYT